MIWEHVGRVTVCIGPYGLYSGFARLSEALSLPTLRIGAG